MYELMQSKNDDLDGTSHEAYVPAHLICILNA
jgi:hypothetical protein